MKKKLLLFLVLPLISTYSCSNPTTTPVCDEPGNTKAMTGISSDIKGLDNGLIVKFKDNVSDAQIQDLNKRLGINSFSILSDELKLQKIEVNNVKAIQAEFQKSSLVEYVEKDKMMSLASFKVYADDIKENCFSVNAITRPDDTFYGLQWNARAILADQAWSITTGSKAVKVAVIDSGVDPNHPDLKDNLETLIDIWNQEGHSDIYTVGGTSVNYGGKDGNGHGTHVTGIMGAAINNGKGIAGISGNVSILPIKAADHRGVTSASILTKAIIRAIEENVKVINLSIGGPKSEGTKALKESVDLAIARGIVFVSATGNESTRNRGIITEVTVPAAYPGVISVSSVTVRDRVANYSNGGPEVEIAAPGGGGLSTEGEKVYSTWPTYKTYEGYQSGIQGPYATLSGTSMSCPHVSAVAALLLTAEPNLTGQQVRVRILSTTEDIDAKGFDQATGYGKINAYKALISNNHDKKQ